jgi:hypothetical protein
MHVKRKKKYIQLDVRLSAKFQTTLQQVTKRLLFEIEADILSTLPC